MNKTLNTGEEYPGWCLTTEQDRSTNDDTHQKFSQP
jgi:hypothetical protein